MLTRIICIITSTVFSVVCLAGGQLSSRLSSELTRSQWLQAIYRGLLKHDLSGLRIGSVDDLSQPDNDGWSLAQRAAFDGRIDVLEILENVGVNIRVAGADGKSPQDYAQFAGHNGVVGFLRDGDKEFLEPENLVANAKMAVIFGDQRTLEHYLASDGFNINEQDHTGRTLAHYAAHFGRVAIARLLATNGINLMLRDDKGQLAFDVAMGLADRLVGIKKGGTQPPSKTTNVYQLLSTASVLLEHTVGIDKKDYKGWPPINFSIVAGDRQRTKELVDKGVKLGEGCQNALEIALVMRDIPTFEFLLQHTHVDVPSRRGDTALMGSAKRGDKWVSDTLIRYGANTNIIELEHGNSILILTAEEGHDDIIDSLIDNDAKVNAVNKFGDSAVIRAAFNGHRTTVDKLFANGADPNVAGIGNMTGLMWAAYWGEKEIVQSFIDNGARRDLVSKIGNNAGQWAKLRGHDDIAEMLGGGDGFVTTDRLDAELLEAVQAGDEGRVLRTLAHGANPDATDEKGDPLIVVATRLGFKQLVKGLLSYRANADALSHDGFSVLMIAAQLGLLEIVEPLLIAGASRKMTTTTNQTAENFAKIAGHNDVIEALQQDWD